MSALADGDLVRRARQGDKDAFAALFTRYEGRIFGYLYRMVGDREWAEDLTQEAFIRAHQHLSHLGPPYDFKSWLYRIAGNLALDGLRRYRREVPLPDWDSGAPEPVDTRPVADPEQQARQAELRAAVWRTLHRLPDAYRQALLLRELEGLSYQEMASIMGISLDNVRVVLHRARLAFRDLYGLQVMAEEGRLACGALNELLSADVGGELDRATRRKVQQHITACPVCQRTRKELLTVSSLLAALAPVFPPLTLRPKVLARLRQLPPSRPPPPAPPPGPAPRPGKGRWIALAVVGGVILVALGVLLGFLLLSGLRAFLTTASLPPSASPTPAVLAAAISPTSLPTESAVASIVPPTPAPIQPPTPTPSPIPCLPDARWVADVTVPDNTVFAPGTPFVKTWRVRNSGTCTWEPGTRLVFVSGDPLGGPPAVDVPALAPGAQTDVSVSLVAPSAPGTYRTNYQFQAPDGTRFGSIIWVQIVVPGTPTATMAPVCAPPPCPSGGVLTCPTPGACPGGCGVVCVTPTAPPSGLAILSFTAEVVQDLPPAGKRLRFSWRTTGATSAGIWSGTQMRFPLYWEAAPPGEGTRTVDIGMTFYRDPTMTLEARDAAGNKVYATAVVPWACQYPWFFPTDNRACPAYGASTTWAAEEPFERGRMIWLQEVRTGSNVYQKVILVFYNDGRYEKYADTFVDGEPESDPSITPPAGLYQPIRGFGKLWRTNSRVRDGLGWATAPEQGFTTQWQMQMGESVGIPFYVRRLDGRLIRAAGWDTPSGSWQEVP